MVVIPVYIYVRNKWGGILILFILQFGRLYNKACTETLKYTIEVGRTKGS